MSTPAPLATWDVLQDLGFEDDESVISVRPGLSFDFGNFKLSASLEMTLLGRVVLFYGVMATRRTLAQVEFEMPIEIDSSEQCAAWIAHHLDKYCGRNGFDPDVTTPWLEMGRLNRRTLPWVDRSEKFRARPHCSVGRDWMRAARKTLNRSLAMVSSEVEVVFRFDGSVLTIQCDGEEIAMSGRGEPWPSQYVVRAGELKNLPKRFMNSWVGVSIWEDKLTIGNTSYTCVVANHSAEDDSGDSSEDDDESSTNPGRPG